MRVFIVTWCKSPETLYGNSLIFESIRTGFPTADITIIDNGSRDDLASALAVKASRVDAHFVLPQTEVPHWVLIDQTVRSSAVRGPICFIDPDVVFWKSVENWNFGNALMAGRLIPRFEDEYSDCVTLPRLHTSFLSFPDVERLRGHIDEIRKTRFEFDPFRPTMIRFESSWLRADCAASLYASCGDNVHVFTEEELDSYDHIFCGTHAQIVADRLKTAEFLKLHSEVKAGNRDIKGLWRRQQAHFLERAI